MISLDVHGLGLLAFAAAQSHQPVVFRPRLPEYCSSNFYQEVCMTTVEHMCSMTPQ